MDIKSVKKLIPLALILTAIFFAGINFGFTSNYNSQFNNEIWGKMFFDKKFIKERHDNALKFSEPKAELNQNTQTESVNNFIIPLSSFIQPPDTIPGEEQFPDSLQLIQENFVTDTLTNRPQDTTGFNDFGDTSSFSQPDTMLNFKDTSKVKETQSVKDSLLLLEMKRDSSARLEQFRYQREDLPYVTLKQQRQYSFFAYPSDQSRKRIIEFDSTGQFVTIKEVIAGEETKILLKMTFEEYLNMQLALRERQSWESLGYGYELKEGKKGLGELIKDFTDFEIPLPSVGVLSIFGEPKISLRIGGAVDIRAAWRNETTEGITTSRLGNTKNEPDFKQQVQINVAGTIGDKLTINADWNTERTFEYENQLKIKYTGYEDEIIQSIEAGNVSLQTSPLVGGSEALFGVKAMFKMGPLTLTALASQKKGEVKEVSVTGGSEVNPFEIRAYNYSINNYFLDTIYASVLPEHNYFNNYYSTSGSSIDSRVRVVELEVWKSITTTQNSDRERNANAFIDLPSLAAGQRYGDDKRTGIVSREGQIETGRFVLLSEGIDYEVHRETGYITFNTQINQQDIIAAYYRVQNGDDAADDNYIGESISVSQSDTSRNLVLKLIKPRNLQPAYTTAWKLLLKNIYYLNSREIKPEGFEFKIKREVSGQEPITNFGNVRFLSEFGLDNLDDSKSPNPDDKFDWSGGITIRPKTGEVIFPVLEPFGRDLPASLPDSLGFPQIYSQSITEAKRNTANDKWLLTGVSSGGIKSTRNLGFNIVENSVRVRLDGRELSPGTDYVMDYNSGQLTIRNDAALVPNADLRVTFEQNDLFQLASKTLLGARGIFDFSPKTKLGFSILNLNQQTLNDKVRIGEEPLSNTIYGLDFNTSAELPILTKALNSIISTREMSSISVAGEYAYIDPDPNTKKSTIPSDQGKSIAYIDDFEGAKKTIPIGISYTSWKDISAPLRLPFLSDTLTPQELMPYKAKSYWFTIAPSDVKVQDIWGDRKQVAQTDEQISVMDYVFLPDRAGTYNHYPDLSDPRRNWGGIMKQLSSTANNLVEENIEFIEFWAKTDTVDLNAKIYIDIGRMSEDVIPDGRRNTEDQPPFNGAIDAEGKEDTGIDGLTDEQERAQYQSTEDDPAGDNFNFQSGSFNYYNINGTQGNAILSDNGRLPDTEDLNRNETMDLEDAYFRYEISLDTNLVNNKFIAGGGGNKGWFLYRIPLKDTSLKVGDPRFENVESIRLFVSGSSIPLHLRITEFNLVGSQWRKPIENDTVISISVINIEDNPEYSPPTGVFQERDRTKVDSDDPVFKNEQSLRLILSGLEPGEKREVFRDLYQPLDLFNYSEMKLFLHGEEQITSSSLSDTANNRTSVYFRFGTDSNNYYEYRLPLRPGWDPNDIKIVFKDLTALKQIRGDSINIPFALPIEGKQDHFYVIRGNPTLTTVKFLSVGVLNNTLGNEIPINLFGEFWVNELRVIGADDSPGWAYSFSTNMKIADIANVSFNMSQQNPYFHRLAEKFGSRNDSRNWGVAADVDLIKILPFKMTESNLRLQYSHSESIGKPLYLPGTDIKVEEAAEELAKGNSRSSSLVKNADQLRTESQTVRIMDSYNASNIKLKIPSNYWLIRDTWNAITFSFNYNQTISRSPTIEKSKDWIWNASANYSLSISPEYNLQPGKWFLVETALAFLPDYKNFKMYYLPQSISADLSTSRNRSVTVTRANNTSPAQEDTSRDFRASRGFGYNWKITEGGFLNVSTNYTVRISSSLAFLETNELGKQRKEKEIWNDILDGNYFGRTNNYSQTFDIRTAPRLPSFWDINKYFTLNFGYNATYQWNNDFARGELGRGAQSSGKLTSSLNLKLKALTAPLFKDDTKKEDPVKAVPTSTTPTGRRGRDREIRPGDQIQDTSNISIKDSINTIDSAQTKPSAVSTALMFLKTVVRVAFFDYENISMNYSIGNTYSSSGIASGGTGFMNFYGFNFKDYRGPSRTFMLGLNGRVGERAANANLSDNFSQSNNFDFKTSKPLWEGARIDLNWKIGWNMNKSTTIKTDENGNFSVSPNNINSTGSINRSFLSLPPVFLFSVFKSGINRVNENYDRESPNKNEALSNAFVEGMESAPFLSKLGILKDLSKYVPRPNWHITWDGLEKFFLFKSMAKKVTFEHNYNSGFTEGWKIKPEGNKEVVSQRIDYAFAPLAGFNIQFGELWGGNLSGNLKYSTRTDYNLIIQTTNITESFSKEIGISASYNKQGFELPLFGIALKNDIEFSFSYSNSKNSEVRYDMANFVEGGVPQNGLTRVTIEPRVRYTMSAKINVTVFYKRTTTSPEGASALRGTTLNEAGLEVHISIQ